LETQTVDIFLWWSIGSSLFFVCIALLFLRGQVRPIRELSDVAEKFGKGQDVGYFKPSGASEVRRAGRAFLVMRERILRQLRTRTQMLDGISHDLRTPLTRMKLQLEMQGDAKEVEDLKGDIRQMEAMLGEYLDYTKGAGGEEPTPLSLDELLAAVIADFNRQGQHVTCNDIPNLVLVLREGAIKRVFANLITNALRHANTCTISVAINGKYAEVYVDDDGTGIPENMREEVFRPFTRLDDARNLNDGGVGLGLTISRDIARSHGGDIVLSESPPGGLRVTVKLPI
jgi:two-component system osmolarity sensor histidine kinase EnvZ